MTGREADFELAQSADAAKENLAPTTGPAGVKKDGEPQPTAELAALPPPPPRPKSADLRRVRARLTADAVAEAHARNAPPEEVAACRAEANAAAAALVTQERPPSNALALQDSVKPAMAPPCFHPIASRHYPHLCGASLLAKDLQICAGCRCAHYASQGHQKQCWRDHKPMCKAWREMQSMEGAPFKGLTHEKFSEIAVCAFKSANGHKPSSKELLGLLQAPRCDACRGFPATIRCEGCCLVAYCSEACRESAAEHHEKVCEKIQHTGQAARLLRSRGQGPGVVSTEQGRLGGWDSYLPKARIVLFDRPLAVADDVHQAVVKDGLSCPLTILEGLRLSKKLDCLNQSSVVIDLVGAAGYEFDAFMKWEEILNFCPAIEDLTVRMVGPDAVTLTDGEDLPCSEDLSARSRAAGRRLNFEFAPKPMRYERWLAENPERPPPTVRAAFNCGFAEHIGNTKEHIWPKALSAIAARHDEVPFVCTSVTPLDAARDMEVAMRAGLTPLVRPTENGFASPLALPDAWDRGANDVVEPAFTFNAILAVYGS